MHRNACPFAKRNGGHTLGFEFPALIYAWVVVQVSYYMKLNNQLFT